MAESFNIYLDESCHLENDGIAVMTQGAVWCPEEKARDISIRVRDIKKHHGLKPSSEIKWGKLSPASLECYLAVVDYFLDDDDLHFRGVVIPDKRRLDRGQFGQSQDDWYYSMCFILLEPIVDPTQHYSIYLDIKDTRSESKRRTLERGLREEKLDGSGNIVRRIQQIRSHESEIMQIADILIGAVAYANRALETSSSKLAVVSRIRERTSFSLLRATWLREPKFNLMFWQPERFA
jgi:hypothetical protein